MVFHRVRRGCRLWLALQREGETSSLRKEFIAHFPATTVPPPGHVRARRQLETLVNWEVEDFVFRRRPAHERNCSAGYNSGGLVGRPIRFYCFVT